MEASVRMANALSVYATLESWCGEGARADDDAKDIEFDAITYSTLMHAYASRDVRGAEKVERMWTRRAWRRDRVQYADASVRESRRRAWWRRCSSG